MANSRRKRSLKKTDKELKKLLKEKDKIDDLVELKEFKSTSPKKKSSVVAAERKKATSRKKEAIVTPERRSVSKNKKKTRSVTVNKEEKEKLKNSNSSKKTSSTKKTRKAIVNKPAKDNLKKSTPKKNNKTRKAIVNKTAKDNLKKSVIEEKEVDIKETNITPTVEEEKGVILEDKIEYLFDEGESYDEVPYSVGVHADLEDTVDITIDTEAKRADDDYYERIRSIVENTGEYHNLYDDNTANDVMEDTGFLVTDVGIQSQDEEYVPKKISGLKILTIFLFTVFMLLCIAFIIFVIYVCTY